MHVNTKYQWLHLRQTSSCFLSSSCFIAVCVLLLQDLSSQFISSHLPSPPPLPSPNICENRKWGKWTMYHHMPAPYFWSPLLTFSNKNQVSLFNSPTHFLHTHTHTHTLSLSHTHTHTHTHTLCLSLIHTLPLLSHPPTHSLSHCDTHPHITHQSNKVCWSHLLITDLFNTYYTSVQLTSTSPWNAGKRSKWHRQQCSTNHNLHVNVPGCFPHGCSVFILSLSSVLKRLQLWFKM